MALFEQSGFEVFNADVRRVDEFVEDPGIEIRRSVRLMQALEDRSKGVGSSRPAAPASYPLVSVIMPMHNASRWVAMALRSLLIQDINIEVLAIDDASTDDTFEVARQTSAGDSRVRLFRLAENVGAYQVRNWAASKVARCEWLSFQDADDFSHPNRFSMQLAHAERRGVDVCGVFTHQFFTSGQLPWRVNTEVVKVDGGLHTLSFYPELPAVTEPRPVAEVVAEQRKQAWNETGQSEKSSGKNDSLAMYATAIIRRKVFLDLGGFDGRTRVGGDRTFAHRLVRQHDFANVPAVLYSRRVHADSLTQSTDTGYFSQARLAHFAEFDRLEQSVCAALAEGNQEQARDLCRSGLYCGDVRVVEEA